MRRSSQVIVACAEIDCLVRPKGGIPVLEAMPLGTGIGTHRTAELQLNQQSAGD